MTQHRVVAGYVTVETVVTPGGSRAHIDVPPGAVLPDDVPADEVAALLRLGRIEPITVPEVPKPTETDPGPRRRRAARKGAAHRDDGKDDD